MLRCLGLSPQEVVLFWEVLKLEEMEFEEVDVWGWVQSGISKKKTGRVRDKIPQSGSLPTHNPAAMIVCPDT